TGTLLYVTGGVFPARKTELTWIDRHGGAQPLAGAAPKAFLNPGPSPGGQKNAGAAASDDRHGDDIWVYDAARGSPTRLTFDGGSRPVWSPDGKRIIFNHAVNSVGNLFQINADGSGKPERVTTSEFGQTATSWTRSGDAITIIQRTTA